MKPHAILMYADGSDANMVYATKFFAPDPVLYISVGGRSYLFASSLEYDRAVSEARVDEVLLLSEMFSKISKRLISAAPTPNFAVAAQFLSERGVRAIHVPKFFPDIYARWFRKRRFQVIPADIFGEQRKVKTREEVQAILEVQRSVEEVTEIVVTFLQECTVSSDGSLSHEDYCTVTSQLLHRMFAIEFVRRDCFAEAGTIVACGPHSAQPHNVGSGPLYAGQPIVMDVFPRSLRTRYWADMSRTFIKGAVPEEWQRVYDVVHAAQELGISMVKAGVRGSDIDNAIREFFKSRGYITQKTPQGNEGFIHGTGHGVGLEIHEAPRVGGDDILEVGNVITIEPGLYFPGKGGVRIEDMVVVRSDGAENLTAFPKILQIP